MCNCIGELGQACQHCHAPIKENWSANWLVELLEEDYCERKIMKRTAFIVRNTVKNVYIGYPQGGLDGEKFHQVESFDRARVFARKRDALLNIQRASTRTRKQYQVVPVTVSM